MNSVILEQVRESAAEMGGCDPLWLRDGTAPVFDSLEVGSGPPLLLLHGLFGALSNWDGVIPLLAKKFTVIALKFPILTAHRSEVKVKALAAYTEYFIRSRNLEPVTLCGNSMGGHVAQRIVLARPELVDCMILSGTSGLYEHAPDSLPIRPDEKFVREHMRRVFYDERFVTDEIVQEMLSLFTKRMNHLNLIHAARSAKRDNLKDVLRNVSVPTLLLWGKEDQVTTMAVAEMFNKLIPGSTLLSVAKCGHAPMIEHPEWFAEETIKYIAANTRRK
jgi:pimeloyl-ACP methyl ester carboxylesterase